MSTTTSTRYLTKRLTEKEKTVIIIVVFRWGLVGISLVSVAGVGYIILKKRKKKKKAPQPYAVGYSYIPRYRIKGKTK